MKTKKIKSKFAKLYLLAFLFFLFCAFCAVCFANPVFTTPVFTTSTSAAKPTSAEPIFVEPFAKPVLAPQSPFNQPPLAQPLPSFKIKGIVQKIKKIYYSKNKDKFYWAVVVLATFEGLKNESDQIELPQTASAMEIKIAPSSWIQKLEIKKGDNLEIMGYFLPKWNWLNVLTPIACKIINHSNNKTYDLSPYNHYCKTFNF